MLHGINPLKTQIPDGLTKTEILEEIPELPRGNWTHWVIVKLSILHIGKKPVKTGWEDVYPMDSVERIKLVFK